MKRYTIKSILIGATLAVGSLGACGLTSVAASTGSRAAAPTSTGTNQEGSPQGTATQSQASPTAGELVSKCLARYFGAKTISGTIIHTVQAMGKSQAITTTIIAERPSKLFLQQVRTDPEAKSWLVTSDGQRFTYPEPAGIVLSSNSAGRLVEPVIDLKKHAQTVNEILQASSSSIGDVSDPLLMVLGWTGAQKALLSRWKTLKIERVDMLDGKRAYTVGGLYVNPAAGGETGQYHMVIDEDGNLLASELDVYFQPSGDPKATPVLVKQLWKCTIAIDGKVDEAKFTVKF